MQSEEIVRVFGNRLRVRVCGLCQQQGRLLLVNLRRVTHAGDFWCPPGGGMAFGESAPEALQREFREETGLEVQVCELRFVNEFIGNSLHAVELFFRVEITGGTLKTGSDPELQTQVLADAGFFAFDEILARPPAVRHNLFNHCRSLDEMWRLSGYYR